VLAFSTDVWRFCYYSFAAIVRSLISSCVVQ